METKNSITEDADDIGLRQKLYAETVAEINKREVSSSENFDKSILTFSSAGLAVSIGFLKDFVPIQTATVPWALYASWSLFTLATCATMASFLVSMRAQSFQKDLAHLYYIDREEAAFTKVNPWDQRTRALNLASGAAFLTAMVLSVLFISLNLSQGSSMPQTKPTETLQRGLPIPALQKVPSAPAQPASGQQAPASAPASNSSGSK